MAETSNMENLLKNVGLNSEHQERARKWLESEKKLGSEFASADIEDLKQKIFFRKNQDEKIVALLVQAEGGFLTEKIRRTQAWLNVRKLPFQEVVAFVDSIGIELPPDYDTEGVNDDGGTSGDEGGHIHLDGSRHGGTLEGGRDNEITTLKGEITTLLNKGPITRVPGSNRIIEEYSKKLKEPGLSKENLVAIRASLNDLQAAVSGFAPKNAQDIIDKINAYDEHRGEKTNEGNMLLYGAVVHELYRLGYRLSFGRGNKVLVDGPAGKEDEASNLTSAFTGKPTVIEWLKRGMLINTSKWTGYMNSYPAKDSATVEKYISTYGEGSFSGSEIDNDFLDSSASGGFDIKGNDDRWITRGMNIHSIAQAAQQAAKKWKEMGYQTPLQKAGGHAAQFGELAYNVAKFGFAAASVWKGTKAVWKTIFSDEAGMKSAWGDFGKTLAWTGAVWYGGAAVKEIANDIKASYDNPDYAGSLKTLSTEDGKAGMYDGFENIFNKVGRGYMPGLFGVQSGLEILSAGVPAHQFTDMWETLVSGRKGDSFREATINNLSRALENSYHTKSGSHAGGIREFFLDMGQWGKDIYDKYFIDPTTAEAGRKFLRAIADYRSEDSFSGASDSIDRDEPISELFASPLDKKAEVAADLGPDYEKFKAAAKAAGIEGLKLTASVGTLGFNTLTFMMGGVRHVVEVSSDFLENFDPKDYPKLMAALKAVGAAGAVAGSVWALSMIPGTGLVFGALKVIGIAGAVGWGGMYIYDKVKDLALNPQDYLDSLTDPTSSTPEAIKNIIKSARARNQQLKDTLTQIRSSPFFSALPAEAQSAIDKLISFLPNLGPGVPPSAPAGAPPSSPSGSPEESYLNSIDAICDSFKSGSETIDVEFAGIRYADKSILAEAVKQKNKVIKRFGGTPMDKSLFKFPTPNSDPDMIQLEQALR